VTNKLTASLKDWRDIEITAQSITEIPFVPCGIGNKDVPPALAQCFCVRESARSRSGTVILTLYRSHSCYKVDWLGSGWFDGYSETDLNIAKALAVLGWTTEDVIKWANRIQQKPDHPLFIASYQLWSPSTKLIALKELENEVQDSGGELTSPPLDWAVANLNKMLEHEHKMQTEKDPWVLILEDLKV
jgi:hypothetical protein